MRRTASASSEASASDSAAPRRSRPSSASAVTTANTDLVESSRPSSASAASASPVASTSSTTSNVGTLASRARPIAATTGSAGPGGLPPGRPGAIPPPPHPPRQSRLAHPALADHHHQRARAVPRSVPALAQPLELAIAPDQHGRRPSVELARQLAGLELEGDILAQDRLVQPAELRAGLHADLIDQQPPRLAVRLQRLGLAPAPIQREHPLAAQALTQRMQGDQRLELRDEVGVTAERQIGVDPPLQGGGALLLEPGDLGLREALVGDVGQRRTTPQPERLPQPGGRIGGAPAPPPPPPPP